MLFHANFKSKMCWAHIEKVLMYLSIRHDVEFVFRDNKTENSSSILIGFSILYFIYNKIVLIEVWMSTKIHIWEFPTTKFNHSTWFSIFISISMYSKTPTTQHKIDWEISDMLKGKILSIYFTNKNWVI